MQSIESSFAVILKAFSLLSSKKSIDTFKTRFFTGFPIGIAVGYLITIAISAVYSDGYYSPCVPELVEATGSEISEMLRAALCGLLGAGFGAISLIWENEKMNIVRLRLSALKLG